MAVESREPLWQALDVATDIRTNDPEGQRRLAEIQKQADDGDPNAQVVLNHVRDYLRNAEISSSGAYLRE